MVVGSTGGGRRGKPSGVVTDAGIIGSGLFANETTGCTVTGPLNTLTKLNLASQIIEDAEELVKCPERTLKQHIDNMLKQFDETAGGIALHSTGCAGVYFTAPCMPYALVKNQLIVYGWKMREKRFKKYCDWEKQNFLKCNYNYF